MNLFEVLMNHFWSLCLMDLFGPYGMFLIRFSFLCIFFGFLAIVEIDFGSSIKIFWNFWFS